MFVKKAEGRHDTSRVKMTEKEAGKKVCAKGGPCVRELIEEGKKHEE